MHTTSTECTIQSIILCGSHKEILAYTYLVHIIDITALFIWTDQHTIAGT